MRITFIDLTEKVKPRNKVNFDVSRTYLTEKNCGEYFIQKKKLFIVEK